MKQEIRIEEVANGWIIEIFPFDPVKQKKWIAETLEDVGNVVIEILESQRPKQAQNIVGVAVKRQG